MRKTILGSSRHGNLFFMAGASLVFAVLTANISASEPSLDKVTSSFPLFKESATGKGNDREDSATRVKVQDNYGKLPLYFIENHGQINEQVKFYEKGNGHTTFFTKRGIYLSLAGATPLVYPAKSDTRVSHPQAPVEEKGIKDRVGGVNDGDIPTRSAKSATIRFVPLGANSNPEITAVGLQECKVYYLMGNDSEKWKTNIPTYKSVVYKGIYKNIDMRFYGNNRQLEYDIIVNPGASPSRVQLLYEGVEGLRITGEGDMEISLKEGKLIQKKPHVYQEIDGKRKEIEGRFVIAGSGSDEANPYNPKDEIASPSARNDKSGAVSNRQLIYGFQVASYNKDYPLIIDPVLAYSTYLGGSPTGGGDGEDFSYGIAVDTEGNAYITGYTGSFDFPLQSPIQGTRAGYFDAFVTKINASGSSLVYSTYLGGVGNYDDARSIAVDTGGNAYITGWTNSFDFPLKNPIQGTNGGYSDAFVTKINADGSSLVYSTYLGGNFDDYGYGIAVDTVGNAYITGETVSSNFPLQNPIQGANAGNQDAFVTKINASGSGFVYSTYLGGNYDDRGYGIDADTGGNAYITGKTNSFNFPLRSPIQGTKGDGNSNYSDVFVTKINASGSALVYSTYMGGSESDYGYGIAVDTGGKAYITGQTWSTNFPLQSPIQGAMSGTPDAFVTKINASGSSLVYSTFLGGGGNDEAHGIAADTGGNAYITGWTFSTNFPIQSPIQAANAGYFDVFVTKINSSGTRLVYSTYLGGGSSIGDYGYGIAVDTVGNAYITGNTTSTDFPLQNPIQEDNAGRSDAFVTKIASATPADPAVVTKPATHVTSTSVILHGNVNPNGLPTRAWFEYGTKRGTYSSKTAKWSVGSGTDSVTMKKKIGNLSSGTQYYFRAAAKNNAGTVYGKRKSFTTK